MHVTSDVMGYQKVQWGGVSKAQDTRRAIFVGNKKRLFFLNELNSLGYDKASSQGLLPGIEVKVIQHGGRYSEKPRSA